MHITFYTDNIDPKIPEMQKAVFNKFGLEINQIKLSGADWKGHGGSIDDFINEVFLHSEDNILVLWDIDCIPLNLDIVNEAISFADNGGIFGIAQKASHIPNSIIYSAPAFTAISRETYALIGQPKWACTDISDCGGMITHFAREKGVEVRLLYPTSVIKPLWSLDGYIMFGKGTTFGKNDIYHAFYSRKDNGNMFVDKCNELLNNL